jgi:photosystem II oxygen evolving enhancer protein PsbQ
LLDNKTVILLGFRNTQKAKQEGIIISRRVGAIVGMSSLCLTTEAVMNRKAANSFEFRMTVPDQTAEEAQSMIRDHAQALLDVKPLLESESWREAQRELRQNSAYLKQDIYTIIQSKEGSVRPLLRKLYSNLFNNVTKVSFRY